MALAVRRVAWQALIVIVLAALVAGCAGAASGSPSLSPGASRLTEPAAKEASNELGLAVQELPPEGRKALAYLKGASSDVQNLGKSKVRGVTTTHYRAQINFAKVLKNIKRRAAEMGFELVATGAPL